MIGTRPPPSLSPRVLAAIVVVLLTWSAARTAQPGARGPDAGSLEAAAAARHADRLRALDPARPVEYLELGEDLLDAPGDEGERRLAVRLLVLACALDQHRAPAATVGASACLALAEAGHGPGDRPWLVAVARLLDGAGAPGPGAPPVPQSPEVAPYRLAMLLGLVRSGDGLAARRLLEDSGLRALLRSLDPLLSRMGVSGGAFQLERDATRWPCTECRNERVVKRARAGGEWKLCPICRGVPGPDLTTDQYVRQLQLEAYLLQGRQRSWGAQLAADGGAPLLDPDPAEVPRRFGIDASLAVYRDGAWAAMPPDAARPDAPRALEASPPAADPPDAASDPQRRLD